MQDQFMEDRTQNFTQVYFIQKGTQDFAQVQLIVHIVEFHVGRLFMYRISHRCSLQVWSQGIKQVQFPGIVIGFYTGAVHKYGKRILNRCSLQVRSWDFRQVKFIGSKLGFYKKATCRISHRCKLQVQTQDFLQEPTQKTTQDNRSFPIG